MSLSVAIEEDEVRGFKDLLEDEMENRTKASDYLYLITSRYPGNLKYIKVGITSDVMRRVSQIKTGCPTGIAGVEVLPLANRECALAIEGMIHSALDEWQSSCEWHEGKRPMIDKLDKLKNHLMVLARTLNQDENTEWETVIEDCSPDEDYSEAEPAPTSCHLDNLNLKTGRNKHSETMCTVGFQIEASVKEAIETLLSHRGKGETIQSFFSELAKKGLEDTGWEY
jgi:hypothetical protein